MLVSLEDLAAELDISALRSPLAPGLHLAFGRWTGRLTPISPLSAGKGADAMTARLGCLGEAVENLSIGPNAHPEPVWLEASRGVVDVRARDLADPDDLGSEGCAAHANPPLARRGAVLERLERAALALWWRSEAPAVELALTPALIDRYRQGVPLRWSRFWRIDAIPGIATCLVVTGDLAGGPMVMGSAAADSPAAACEAALAEALFAEVALLAPPQHPDHRQAIALSRALAGRIGPAGLLADATDGPVLAVEELIAHCHRAGHDLALAELTHPHLGIPVWRAVSFSLPRWRPILLTGFDV